MQELPDRRGWVGVLSGIFLAQAQSRPILADGLGFDALTFLGPPPWVWFGFWFWFLV